MKVARWGLKGRLKMNSRFSLGSSAFGFLAPKLHHAKYKSIRANAKEGCNSSLFQHVRALAM
jgi:hypothetical protein